MCHSGRQATEQCVSASTSIVKLEVVTLLAPLSSCTVLPFSRAVEHHPHWSLVTAVCVDHDITWLVFAFV